MTEKKKKCFVCKKYKPHSEFNPHPKTKDRLSSICTSCENETDEQLKCSRESIKSDFEDIKFLMKAALDQGVKEANEKIRQRDELLIASVFEYIKDTNKIIEDSKIFQSQLFYKDKWKLFIEIVELLKDKNLIQYDLRDLLNLDCKIVLTSNRVPHLFGLLQVLIDFKIIKSHNSFKTNKQYLLEVKNIFECYSIETLENRFTDYVTKPKNNNADAVNSAKNYFLYRLKELLEENPA
jgi:hypothetical protein